MAFGPHNEILRPFGDKHVICTKFDDPQAIILTLHIVCFEIWKKYLYFGDNSKENWVFCLFLLCIYFSLQGYHTHIYAYLHFLEHGGMSFQQKNKQNTPTLLFLNCPQCYSKLLYRWMLMQDMFVVLSGNLGFL